jgi:quercetin dioxygenase-like cupin family protein
VTAPRPTALASAPAFGDGLSDVSIAGDPLAWPHLAPEPLAHPTTVGDFAALARRVAAERDRWEPLVRYDALTRWYARLETGPGYEIWLLSWLPGQGSGAHDHGRSSAVMTLLQGELTELGAGRGPRTLTAGTQRVIAPGYVHEVVNDTLEPAVSLHVYFPGLTQMTPYPKQVLRQGTTEGQGALLA